MRKKILYLYTVDELNIYAAILLNILVRALKVHYEVEVCEKEEDYFKMKRMSTIKMESYSIVFIQNSKSLIKYRFLLNKLKNIPLIFVSYSCDINAYIAPIDNLYSVLNFDEANLKSWGIPKEMQICLKIPVLKRFNFSQTKTNSETYQILFYPDYYSVDTSCDTIIATLEQFNNVTLTIVSDDYEILKPALPPNSTIISRKKTLPALKRSHIVIASKYNAIQAMTYAKPCIVLGDYGLGGMVTLDNYEILKSCDFKGRAGASFKELIPSELFQYEIQKALSADNYDDILQLQKKALTDYNYKKFQRKIYENLSSAILVSESLMDNKKILQLKPLCISTLSTKEINGVIYLKNSNHFFCEIDKDLQNTLEQCDGKNTLQKILSLNTYTEEEVQILIENLKELWNNKLIVFL